MTKARENSDYTGLAADIVAGDTAARAGRKNLIINGGFDVWQRGTSFTPAANYGYSADRARLSSNATVNITKESASLEGNVVNTIKLAIVSPTSGNNIRYDQRIEEFDYFKNKTFTLSFWVKASRTHALNSSYLYFGGGGVNTFTFALGNATTTWTKKTTTFSVGDLSTATGTYADLVIGISSDGASIDIEYAQVQLELGSVATDFEHRSYGEILALCQRFYYSNITNGNNRIQIDQYVYAGIYPVLNLTHPMTMRVDPTITKIGVWSGGNITPSTTSFVANTTSLRLQVDASATGRGYLYPPDGEGFSCDAEL